MRELSLFTGAGGGLLGFMLGGLMSNTARDGEYHEGYVAGKGEGP